MQTDVFSTPGGQPVPAITAEEMRTVDRVAVEEFGLTLPQMMEHAGRSLARLAVAFEPADRVVVLAGSGGNGGGGLACARHLANRGRLHGVVLDRHPEAFAGAAADQLRLLELMDVPIEVGESDTIAEADLLVDALIGYGLSGAARGTAADLIETAAAIPVPSLSLDVPSGLDATTGETPSVAIDPDRTLTLALPKTGLIGGTGQISLGDLGIPAAVYEAAGVPYSNPFDDTFLIDLLPVDG